MRLATVWRSAFIYNIIIIGLIMRSDNGNSYRAVENGFSHGAIWVPNQNAVSSESGAASGTFKCSTLKYPMSQYDNLNCSVVNGSM